MPFIVGASFIGLSGLVIWGAISGRLARMLAAFFPSNGATTTSFTPPPTGFDQLIPGTAVGGTSGVQLTSLSSGATSATTGTTTAKIPTWQETILNQQAQQGQLHGVPAIALVGIDQAESGGQGGYINSSGYGGFFGLGANTTYPTGYMSEAGLLDASPSGFTSQAQIAAGELASLASKAGGNLYTAEQEYQGGSSEGINIFKSLGVPQYLGGTAVA